MLVSDRAVRKALATAALIVRRRYHDDDECHSVANFAVGSACAYWCGIGDFHNYTKRSVRLALWKHVHRDVRRNRAEIEYCKGHREHYDELLLPSWSIDFDTLPRDELKLVAKLRYGTSQSWQQLSELTGWPVWQLRAMVREVTAFFRARAEAARLADEDNSNHQTSS